MLFKVPLMLTQIMPPAVVISVLMSLGLLARRNEIIALRASGISLLQTTLPILALALAISMTALVWNETVVPYSSRMFQFVNNVEIRKRAMRGISQRPRDLVSRRRGFYSIDYVDRGRQTVHGLTDLPTGSIESGFHLEGVIEVPRAQWHDGRWAFAHRFATAHGTRRLVRHRPTRHVRVRHSGDHRAISSKSNASPRSSATPPSAERIATTDRQGHRRFALSGRSPPEAGAALRQQRARAGVDSDRRPAAPPSEHRRHRRPGGRRRLRLLGASRPRNVAGDERGHPPRVGRLVRQRHLHAPRRRLLPL